MHVLIFRRLRAAILGTALGIAMPVDASPIPFNDFLEFGFTEAGIPATGCDPADPLGPFCIESSGTPTFPLPAPPWEFSAPVGGAVLTVVDAFEAGDRFEIFNFGALLGPTSVPGAGNCGDDPVPCLADPNMSRGVFALLPGDYAITIVPTVVPEPGGVGYLRVVVAQVVPEPPSLPLLAAAMLALLALPRKRRGSR